MKGKTDNLMDYGGGTHLAKWQWDEIFSPALLVNPFESDDDAMAVTFGKFTESSFKINKAGMALAPNGYLVNLPSGAEIQFLCDDGNLLGNGYLHKFSIGSDTWVAQITPQSWGILFGGYLKNGKIDESIISASKPKQGDQVFRVSQHTNAKNERELSVSLVKIKDSNDPNSFDIVEKSETRKVSVTCGNTEYWDSLKPGLESLNNQLNQTWGVNVIDRDGNSYSLSSGGKGAITYKYDKNGKNWTVDISGISNDEVKQIITGAIAQKLSAFSIDETGKSQITTTVSSFSTEDGGEFSFGAGLHWYDWGPVLCDAGMAIYESSKLPESFWNKDNAKYNGYPLHTPSTVAGVSDGAIEEVLSIPLLVKFGVEVITDKEMAKSLWESVKNINVESIKNAAVDFYNKKKDQYTSDKPYIVGYTAGYDAVQVATIVSGGTAIFTKGSKESLEKGMKETGEVLGKKVRKFTQKEIDDYVKLATKNPEANKVMLGQYLENNPTSYHIRAKNEGYTYFELDNWKEAEALVNKNYDELWKINKQFIDNQKALNKEFYFSHNIWEYEIPSFRSREAEYLIDLGAKDFIKINENTWKVIW
ncbi:hypothetical protein FACS189455_4110 [Bacteroidia bacterium]|nr:hypothetical protein FACS189455_4110 [Bacteroidia bacterium]